jgi:hypothetical protein
MVIKRSDESFFRSMGKEQRGIIASRNMYLRSNDPHYINLRQISFLIHEGTHADGILSHKVKTDIFFVTIYQGHICCLSVTNTKNMSKGLEDAKSAYVFLHKYVLDGFRTL